MNDFASDEPSTTWLKLPSVGDLGDHREPLGQIRLDPFENRKFRFHRLEGKSLFLGDSKLRAPILKLCLSLGAVSAANQDEPEGECNGGPQEGNPAILRFLGRGRLHRGHLELPGAFSPIQGNQAGLTIR